MVDHHENNEAKKKLEDPDVNDEYTTYDFKFEVSGTNWSLMHNTEYGWFYLNATIPDCVCEQPIELWGRADIDAAIANYMPEPPSPQPEENSPAANSNAKKLSTIPIDTEPPYNMNGNRRKYYCRHCGNGQPDKTKCLKHETGCHSNTQARLQTIMKGFIYKARKTFQCLFCSFVGDRPDIMPRHVRFNHRSVITGDKKQYKINDAGLAHIEKQSDEKTVELVQRSFSQLPQMLAEINSKTTPMSNDEIDLFNELRLDCRTIAETANMAYKMAETTANHLNNMIGQVNANTEKQTSMENTLSTHAQRLDRNDRRIDELETLVVDLRRKLGDESVN